MKLLVSAMDHAMTDKRMLIQSKTNSHTFQEVLTLKPTLYLSMLLISMEINKLILILSGELKKSKLLMNGSLKTICVHLSLKEALLLVWANSVQDGSEITILVLVKWAIQLAELCS